MKNIIKILLSKKFWKDFFEYYSAENIAKRMVVFASRLEKWAK